MRFPTKIRNSLLFIFLLSPFFVVCQDSSYENIVYRYIDKYKDVARGKMDEFGIPASITLAQGILESNAGQSDLAVKANNHFGIKCHKEWTGERFYKDDDKPDECFRKYANPFESFRDHSLFLTTRERYKGLFSLARDDYKGWAEGLKMAGYATNPKYAELLIRTIERFNLSIYDRPEQFVIAARAEKEEPDSGSIIQEPYRYFAPGADGRKVYINNHCMMVLARSGDDLTAIARAFEIPLEKLRSFNDLKPGMKIREGVPVYLQKKKSKGVVSTHTLKTDESLWDVAQLYAIRLSKLVQKNHLKTGIEPMPGMVLKLR